MFQFIRAAPSNPRWPPIKFEQKWRHRLTSVGAPITSWGRGRPLLGGTILVRCYGFSSVKVRLVPPIPPSCRHRGTPELPSAVEGEIGTARTRELSSVQGHDRRVRGHQGARSQWLRFIKAFFVLGFILDRVELAENQEAIAACVLCKKGVQEQFVARSNGSEYVRCSNWGVAIFVPSRICRVTSTWCSWTWPAVLRVGWCRCVSTVDPGHCGCWSALLCLPRPLALYLLLLDRFGSDHAPADRAVAVEPFEEGLKSRLLVNENSIFLLLKKIVVFFILLEHFL